MTEQGTEKAQPRGEQRNWCWSALDLWGRTNICVTSPSVTIQWHEMQGLGASNCPCFDLGYFGAGFCIQGPLWSCGTGAWALEQGEGVSPSLLVHLIRLYPLLVLSCTELNVFSSFKLFSSTWRVLPWQHRIFLCNEHFFEKFSGFFYSCTCLHSSSLWQTSCIGGDPCSWGWFLFLFAFRSRRVYIIKQGIFLVYWAFPVVLSIGWRISGSDCPGSLQKGWGCSASGRAALQGQVPILLSPESRDPGMEIPV